MLLLSLTIFLVVESHSWEKIDQGSPLTGRSCPLVLSQSRGLRSRDPWLLRHPPNQNGFLINQLLVQPLQGLNAGLGAGNITPTSPLGGSRRQ